MGPQIPEVPDVAKCRRARSSLTQQACPGEEREVMIPIPVNAGTVPEPGTAGDRNGRDLVINRGRSPPVCGSA